MDYNNWYALSINMNKERACKSELLARKAVFQDTHLEDVEYLQRKEIVIEKSGKRKVKNKLLMSGYLLVKVKPQLLQQPATPTVTLSSVEEKTVLITTRNQSEKPRKTQTMLV